MTSGSLFTCGAALLTVLGERLGVDSLVDRQGGEKDGQNLCFFPTLQTWDKSLAASNKGLAGCDLPPAGPLLMARFHVFSA